MSAKRKKKPYFYGDGSKPGAILIHKGETAVRKSKSAEQNAKLVLFAEAVLKQVEFPEYHFTVREGHGGVFLRAWYWEKDIYKPEAPPEKQETRKWVLSPHMGKSEIVQTAFKCVYTSYEHRAREHFTYKGARVFGPHFDIEDLVKLCKSGREDAGGRKA